MAIRKKLIRTRVEELLINMADEQPPVDLEKIAGAVGLEIRYQPASEDDISGCLIRKDGHGVIGVNPNQHINRQRFTVAHEIGHWLLHAGDEIHVDRNESFQVNFRDSKSSVAQYPEEMEANFFAAELLMPASFLARDAEGAIDLSADNDEALRKLAGRYQVSVQALTYRLINLGLLPAIA